MKDFLISIFIGLQALLGIGSEPVDPNFGATILFPHQGGTGIGSATAGDVGKVLAVSDDSPFTYELQTVSGTGDITNGSSLGTGLNIFDSKSGSTLRFNSISAGSNISISTTSNSNTLVISSTGGSGSSAYEIATTSGIAVPQVAYFTQTGGRTTLGSVATGTITCSGTGVSCSTTGLSVLGGNLTITGSDTNASSTLLSDLNTWSARQDFNGNASTTGLTVTGSTYLATAGGNVGVGTTSPQGSLHVYSGAIVSPNAGAAGLVIEGGSNNGLSILSSGTARIFFGDASANAIGSITYTHSGDFMSFNTAGTEKLRIQSDGNVGIGTTSPQFKLDLSNGLGGVSYLGWQYSPLSSNSRSWGITKDILDYGDFAIQTSAAANNTLNVTRFYIDRNGNVGLGTTTPFAKLSVESTAGTAQFVIGSSTATQFIVDKNGNVGIGTTSPYAKLSVVGEVVASHFTGTTTSVNTFPYASSTAFSSSYASSTDLRAGTLRLGLSDGCLNITSGVVGSTGSACGSGGGGTFPFTVNSWGNSTTTTLGFLNGFLSTASSTISGDLRLSSLSQGYAGIGSGGRLYSIASSSVSQATTTWKSLVQAWVYPDAAASEACKADDEFADGRRIHTLKVEYYTVNSSGDITLLPSSDANYACNGYSSANATTTTNSSTEQFITVSGNATAFAALMGDTGKQQTFINTVTALATSTTFTGVEIDIEGYGSWSQANTDKYYVFLDNLGKYLHMNGKKLMVDVPPIWNSAANTDSGTGDEWDSANSSGYYTLKYEAFNNIAVDYITIMAYDYHFDYGAGSSISPLKWVDEVITFAQKKIIDNDKIIIGLPAYGYYGTTAGFSFTSQTYDQISLQTGFSGATRDSTSGEMKWTNGGNSYVYNDSTSLEIKREAVEKRGIRRVSFWHLGGNQWFASNKRIELGNLPAPVLSNWFAPFASTTQATTTMLTPLNVAIGTTTANTRVSATFTLKGTMTNILQIFTSAGTKIIDISDNGTVTVLGTWNFGGATVTGLPYYPAFTYSTSTAWTGTTTIPLGPAYNAQTWRGVKCFTDTGTLNVSFYDGTNRMNMFNASTTVGTVTLGTNNTFTASEKRYVDVGTPASSPTKISCTVSFQDN